MSKKRRKAILAGPAKRWYASKTLWVNIIGLVCAIIQIVTGDEWLDPEKQLAILGAVNLLLRLITGTAIIW